MSDCVKCGKITEGDRIICDHCACHCWYCGVPCDSSSGLCWDCADERDAAHFHSGTWVDDNGEVRDIEPSPETEADDEPRPLSDFQEWQLSESSRLDDLYRDDGEFSFRDAYNKSFVEWLQQDDSGVIYEPLPPAPARWKLLAAYGVVIVIGLAMIIIGFAGAGTHLAPDCPGPTIDCFYQASATANARVQR